MQALKIYSDTICNDSYIHVYSLADEAFNLRNASNIFVTSLFSRVSFACSQFHKILSGYIIFKNYGQIFGISIMPASATYVVFIMPGILA